MVAQPGTFLYPREITIQRPAEIAPTTVGAVGYQGTTEAAETFVYGPVFASIIGTGAGTALSGSSEHLPADSPIMHWNIFLPAYANTTVPLIMEQDVVYDDLGRRFQVVGAQPTPLGEKLICIRLKA